MGQVMHELDFDKERLAALFPEHIRDQCFQAFEEGRSVTRAKRKRLTPDEVRADCDQKVRDDYQRATDALNDE